MARGNPQSWTARLLARETYRAAELAAALALPLAAVEVLLARAGPLLRLDGLLGDDVRALQTASGGEVQLLAPAGYRDREPRSALIGGPNQALRALDPRLAAALDVVAWAPAPMQVGRFRLEFGQRVYLMGILNATPDSFYDQGAYFELERGIAHGLALAEQGADIIEVGGETAWEGFPILPEEEIARIRPRIERLIAALDRPICVETHKPAVAEVALSAGAVLINDISGLADPRLAEVVARHGAGLMLMHIRGRPRLHHTVREYRDVLGEVIGFLSDARERAVEAGVARERIAVDPGLGFAKWREDDLVIMRRFAELRALGQPILLASSHKDYIEEALELPRSELTEGTAAAVALGVAAGADIVRAHDVRTMRRVATMAAVASGRQPWPLPRP